MKTIRISIYSLLLLGMMAACNDYKGYQKTEDGLYYRFHTQNESNKAPQTGDVLSISMEIKSESDSIVQPAKTLYTMMQEPKFPGDVFSALSLMHEGDSATFIISAEDFYKTYNYGDSPAFVTPKSMVFVTLCMHEIQTFDEYKSAQIQAALEQEKIQIDQYLKDHNIDVEPTASGLYYVETKAGKGKNPIKGAKCTVNYKGTLLDGTVFDSSEGRAPFEFELGMEQVIAGWDEAISMMKKGGKATLILPSSIAYGERGAGNVIPPFSPLVFEVELIDFK